MIGLKMVNRTEIVQSIASLIKSGINMDGYNIFECNEFLKDLHVFINEDNEVKILMTLTSPNCPVAESLPKEVEDKVKSIDEVKDAEVEITFDPPWTKDLMSDEAKLELGFM